MEDFHFNKKKNKKKYFFNKLNFINRNNKNYNLQNKYKRI